VNTAQTIYLVVASLAVTALAGCGTGVVAPAPSVTAHASALPFAENAPTALCHFGPAGCHPTDR
jgi:hypothetical protein